MKKNIDEKTCGTRVRFVEIPLTVTMPDDPIGVCECNWRIGSESGRARFEAMLPSDGIDGCEHYEPREVAR